MARRLGDAASARSLPDLVREFAEGGVTVETGPIRTIVQADGDVQMILGRRFRALSPNMQAVAFDVHLRAVNARLAPLERLEGAATGLRAAIVIASVGVTGLLLLLQRDSADEMRLWTEVVLPRVTFAVLTFHPTLLSDLMMWVLWRILAALIGRTALNAGVAPRDPGSGVLSAH